MQGKNPKIYPIASHYPREPWLSCSHNTSCWYISVVMCVNTLRTTRAFFPSLGGFFPLSTNTLITLKYKSFLWFKTRSQHLSHTLSLSTACLSFLLIPYIKPSNSCIWYFVLRSSYWAKDHILRYLNPLPLPLPLPLKRTFHKRKYVSGQEMYIAKRMEWTVQFKRYAIEEVSYKLPT